MRQSVSRDKLRERIGAIVDLCFSLIDRSGLDDEDRHEMAEEALSHALAIFQSQDVDTVVLLESLLSEEQENF